MRAIIDTCVIVDALQNREPFCADAQAIFILCANRQIEGCLTAKAITDIYYLTHKQTHSDKETRDVLFKLCALFALLDTTEIDVRNALSSDVSDFEDAVMAETALRTDVDCIVTRNTKDYRYAKIAIYTPPDFLNRVANDDEPIN